MCLAMVVSLGLIWLAYSTGYRNGRESAPEFFAFETKRIEAEAKWWEATRAEYDPDADTCVAILEAIRRP